MDPAQHHKEFRQIIKKYSLEDRAGEIAELLTDESSDRKLSPEQFAERFKMSEKDAKIFLTWIHRGLDFKEKHIDPNKKK